MDPKAVVITPAYSHAHHRTLTAIQQSGLPWLARYENSDLPRIRSVLIEEALAYPRVERVIFLDADVVPHIATLHALATSPAVTPERALWGMYVLRDGTRWSVNPEDPGAALGAIERGERFPIRSGGLGIAAVHRESLARVGAREPYIVEDEGLRWRPFCVPVLSENAVIDTMPPIRTARYLADDGSLCWRLREAGTALVCDPRLRAGHMASVELTEPRDETPRRG